MLAYQPHISHQNFARNSSPPPPERRSSVESPDPQGHRSPSPDDEDVDYVRHQLRRQSLTRSTSPVRSHSPAYHHPHHHHIKSPLAIEHHQQHQIKRSLSEEDLRISNERRRLSKDADDLSQQQHHRNVIISHRPQILMNYHKRIVDHHTTDEPSEDDGKKLSESSSGEPFDEVDDDVPLDLSMGSKKKQQQRGRSDSTTDSDDSTGLGDEGRCNEGRAYKKSLMKRYCEFSTVLAKPFLYLYMILMLSEKHSHMCRVPWPNSHIIGT